MPEVSQLGTWNKSIGYIESQNTDDGFTIAFHFTQDYAKLRERVNKAEADSSNLSGKLFDATERIAELEAQVKWLQGERWTPVATTIPVSETDEEMSLHWHVSDEEGYDTFVVYLSQDGENLVIEDYDGREGTLQLNNIRLCRKEPSP